MHSTPHGQIVQRFPEESRRKLAEATLELNKVVVRTGGVHAVSALGCPSGFIFTLGRRPIANDRVPIATWQPSCPAESADGVARHQRGTGHRLGASLKFTPRNQSTRRKHRRSVWAEWLLPCPTRIDRFVTR